MAVSWVLGLGFSWVVLLVCGGVVGCGLCLAFSGVVSVLGFGLRSGFLGCRVFVVFGGFAGSVAWLFVCSVSGCCLA